MIKKTALAFATAATIGLSALSFSTPAEAGYWYHGSWFALNHGWEGYHCWTEWRTVQVWHHGVPYWEKARVKVCD